MQQIRHDLLDMAGLETLRNFRLHPAGKVEGNYSGPHPSSYRGSSVEFADYRTYADGDDIRQVDWKTYARTDRYYIRLYESERNLMSYVLMDTSASMAYGGTALKTDTKLRYAGRLIAALGYLTIRQGDAFGLSLANTNVTDHFRPGRSWQHFEHCLERISAAGGSGGTDLGRSLETLFSGIRRRGTLMVFSDFIDTDPAFWKRINLFRQSRFHIILFQILHPEELELPRIALGRFTDSETPHKRFSIEPDLVRDRYRERIRAFLREVEGNARSRGCEWVLARTDENPYAFLKRYYYGR